MEDDFRFKGMRMRLVREISQKGITDKKVLDAILKVPRHFFMDSSFVEHAYQDKAFPISAGQTISQPYTVAFQSQLLEIQPADKVLEIGTGSGYQTAILLEMGALVYSIERHRELFYQATSMLDKMGYKPMLFWGDGYLGKPGYSPFDKILITAGAPFIPEDLKMQLRVGGYLVAPVGSGSTQVMTRIIKESETEYIAEEYGYFSFVPFLRGTV
jgi:protein-L-isoaspartate(D-aspartate) O-methyltransferase